MLPCELPVVLSRCEAPTNGTTLPLPKLILDKVEFTPAKSEDGFNGFRYVVRAMFDVRCARCNRVDDGEGSRSILPLTRYKTYPEIQSQQHC